MKHLGINEKPVTVDDVDSYKTIQEEAFTMTHDFQDDWMNSDIEMTNGNSSDSMNEGEFSNSARITHDGVQELGTNSGTETNAISAGSNVDASDSELTINELDKETADSTDEEVIDMNDTDDIGIPGCPGLRRRRFRTRDHILSPSQENEKWNNDNGDEEEEEGKKEQQEEKDANKEEETEAKGSQWKISKLVGNRTTYIHIKQALKLILPREYIARCRQKQHWAAKYLSGRAPGDPKHDIVKFGNVALKSVQQGQKVFDIAHVEDIQSAKDGSQSISFKLKGDTTMRCRFSFYQRSSTGDTYHIHPSLGFTTWRPSSSILGAVELIPDTEDMIGCYKLHDDSKKRLDEMGYICREDLRDNEPGIAFQTVEDQPENPLPDDFYEIDDVLERRLSKDTLTYEYRARFKGYSSEDDMWLPASYFNRALNYESVSTFGRKRKHKIDPDAAPELPEKKRRAAPLEKKMMKKEYVESRKSTLSEKRKTEARVKNINPDVVPELPEKKRGMAPLEEKGKKKKNKESRKSTSSQKRKTEARMKKKVVNRSSKGKVYRSSLPSGSNDCINEKSPAKEESSAPATDANCTTTSVINVEESSQEGVRKDTDVLADVLSRDDNFRYPR